VPRRWDDSRFQAGYPGSHVPLTRKTGASWYVNADQTRRILELAVSFIDKGCAEVMGGMITHCYPRQPQTISQREYRQHP